MRSRPIAAGLITAVLISMNLSYAHANAQTERICKEANYKPLICSKYDPNSSSNIGTQNKKTPTPTPKKTDLNMQGQKCNQFEKDMRINGCRR